MVLTEKQKIYQQAYRDSHKEKTKEYNKQYRLNNKDKIKQQKKQYKQDNIDKLKEKFNCQCGGKYTRVGKSSHIKTKKHIKFLNLSSLS